MVDEELMNDFLEECDDIFMRVYTLLEELTERDPTVEEIESLFRAIHTLKGGTGMFSMEAAKNASHDLESLLGALKQNTSAFDCDHVQRQVDKIESLIKGEEPTSEASVQSTENQIKPTVEASANATYKPDSSDKLPDESTLSPSKKANETTPTSNLTLKKKPSKKSASDILRVPVQRVNRALNSVWEIFLLRNQIAYLFEKNKSALAEHIDMFQDWEILDNSLRRNIAELESTAMSMRMNNLSSLFSRMKKVVRSYLHDSGKKIDFSTLGEDIELDKKVIDMLGEPLIHLVRNAMDHGIENANTRSKAGKSPQGSIKLSAKSLSDKVIITIEDDGKGIDSEKLLESATKKGLDVSGVQSPEDAINLIFASGFSTSEKVTETSGRGVGMDAVKKSINKLGGEVFVETEIGKGSIFKIELPLSMSVISSIIYEINGKTYASGINNLVEICRESESKIHNHNGESLFLYRGNYLPCYDLRDTFHPEQKQPAPIASVCVLNINDNLTSFRVNRVLKHTEIVVKEIRGIYPKLDCVSGVSILATGDPIFILSLVKIHKKLKQLSRRIDAA